MKANGKKLGRHCFQNAMGTSLVKGTPVEILNFGIGAPYGENERWALVQFEDVSKRPRSGFSGAHPKYREEVNEYPLGTIYNKAQIFSLMSLDGQMPASLTSVAEQ